MNLWGDARYEDILGHAFARMFAGCVADRIDLHGIAHLVARRCPPCLAVEIAR
jgi:hypothetical protein